MARALAAVGAEIARARAASAMLIDGLALEMLMEADHRGGFGAEDFAVALEDLQQAAGGLGGGGGGFHDAR